MRASASLVSLACLVATSRAAAQEVAAPPESASVPLHHDLVVDGTATAGLGALLAAWRLARSSIDSSSCTICDGSRPGKVNAVDDWFRTALRRRDGAAAQTTSDVLAYGIAPAMGAALTYAAATSEHRSGEVPLNALLVLEATFAALAVNEAFGAVFRRERPNVHALTGAARSAALAETSALDSFPAGSTASIMAITAATATLATLRGYRLAPLVWIIGTTLGLTSTYLQIAADHSYFSDNLTGAAIGLGVGTAIPLLFHRPLADRPSAATRWLRGATLTSSAVPGGRVVGVGWSF